MHIAVIVNASDRIKDLKIIFKESWYEIATS